MPPPMLEHNTIIVERLKFREIFCALNRYIVPLYIQNKIIKFPIEEYTFGDKSSISIQEMLDKKEILECPIITAYLNRIALILIIIITHEKSTSQKLLNINLSIIWNLLYKSIFILNGETLKVMSSISSQGFMAIPIYKNENGEINEQIRLHIWSKSLNCFIDASEFTKFNIHSHLLHSQSWILHGEIANTVYDIEFGLGDSNLNVFNIKWGKPKHNHKDLQRKSFLENSFIPAIIVDQYTNIHSKGTTYELEAGRFHSSAPVNINMINATLFLFRSVKSRTQQSYVIGPKNYFEGPKLNYRAIECNGLLNQLNELI